MKIAIIGSRKLIISDMRKYISENCTEVVSGGASGIDACAREYAKQNNIKITEFIPNYKEYGRAAPIVRNKRIVDYSDEVIAFWDGASKGTANVIHYCKKIGKKCTVIIIEQ